MSDYQAIYDAVRSKITGGDIGNSVERAILESFDISYQIEAVKQEFLNAAFEMQRPFYLLKPPVYPDGDQWCCLYGEDLMSGVAGFGETPHRASLAFDEAWFKSKLTGETNDLHSKTR